MHRSYYFVCVLALIARPSVGQRPVTDVSLGWSVDTNITVLAELTKLVTEYLQLPQPGRTATSLWKGAEHGGGALYDLTAEMVYQRFPATLVEMVPTDPTEDTYVIKTLFATADSNGQHIIPLALQRLYAEKTPTGWVLSGALPRVTATWSTHEFGPIVFHVPPSAELDPERATRATVFVDSLATALDVRLIQPIHYYRAGSIDEMWRIIGLDYYVSPSGPGQGRGGRAFAAEYVVIAGNPDLGEAYLHELAHVVLGPFRKPGGPPSTIAHEGVATWLAGSRDRSYASMRSTLAEYQRQFPEITIENLIRGRTPYGWRNLEVDAFYATAAVIADVIHQQLGPEGIKAYLRISDDADAALQAIATLVNVSSEGMDAWWRAAAVRGR